MQKSPPVPSFLDYPFWLSQALLSTVGTDLSVLHADQIPTQGSLIVVSNHRSFLDPFVVMAALNRSVRFARHRYMGRVPLLREMVQALGCFSLHVSKQSQDGLFSSSVPLPQSQWLGIFPEGAKPMVQTTQPQELGEFHRGFAHLALRSQVQPLGILPVAIASHVEVQETTVPLQVLSWFDPSEPLFQQSGWHPAVFYRRVSVVVGQPLWITPAQQQQYKGKQAKAIAADITRTCKAEVAALLREGYQRESGC
ncbi:MAG: 1-acyl-sn-glycerol-3-phosphate acyltransferase [Thermosynechococcaceae cyanobacterium MS004]|nr:1-acyl-sn-glycerol-3-phosphate acyltransferase [Thermosynechococcaceae cyanobacterium MS004]